ncbi:MAG: bifunctional phosphopantothenoylcysteine decarboxylase/phosphopantothenate--cysteine ligase CoaBC [Nitrospiraceae bacterium]|uniref:bifunctional phosphopantothenoylcysteine decarboxylase/phosphopantothenate--cysteine ligase CoaBC n=1 Tax=Nitrospira cf. moscoviensis SBR1015 TaxID=96242 RepID=UPI000B3BC528|nr:bifunctional phosphopantothenoylcysteine decarboxylase/phosphopantothenate--cysteine ligase CoaBC [Nitrospira cf. moscoviensis SBR1015]MBY0246985.1 bifunctional phosphopantothenoylcysteine decarboxylase/phosphopantothenate--cysteine ligase CoaBC [Nitrospiraceae bacterium]
MDQSPAILRGRRLVLGVTGSIAAYKAVSLLRALKCRGASVSVVMTESATKFVAPLTFEVLSGEQVTTGLFEAREEMRHLTVPEGAHAVIIAPATANFLAKAAVGLADDVLSTMLLTAQCPLIIAPAMDGGMWEHPTVVEHVRMLRARGVVVLDPEEGPLASGQVAQGRLAAEPRIVEAVEALLIPQADWLGQRVLVSAGPTQEAIDPVRFISNRSSGKMGYAIAEAARDRGAEVVLVTGPTALVPPAGVEVVCVTSAQEMADSLCRHFAWATVVVMAAAVADFRPREQAVQKMKKQGRMSLTLDLEVAPDILAMLSAKRTTQLLVGFAAETEDVVSHAMAKLVGKGLDAIVANDVTKEGGGFGSDDNAAVVLSRGGRRKEFGLMSKRRLADHILTEVRDLPVTCRTSSIGVE